MSMWFSIAALVFLVLALIAGFGEHQRRVEALEKEMENWKRSLGRR